MNNLMESLNQQDFENQIKEIEKIIRLSQLVHLPEFVGPITLEERKKKILRFKQKKIHKGEANPRYKEKIA